MVVALNIETSAVDSEFLRQGAKFRVQFKERALSGWIVCEIRLPALCTIAKIVTE
jgi:hypothetical protein